MKKIYTLATLIAALALSGSVYAEKDYRRGGPPGGKGSCDKSSCEKQGKKGARPAKMLGMLLHNKDKAEQFGVSEDQVSQLEDLMYNHQKENISLRADKQTAQLDIQRAMNQDSPSEEEVLGLIDKAAAIDASIKKSEIKLKLAVKELLGEETMEKIKSAGRKHAQQRGERWKRGSDSKKRQGKKGPPESVEHELPVNEEEVMLGS